MLMVTAACSTVGFLQKQQFALDGKAAFTMTTRLGIVTMSDRAARGQYQDLSGAAIRAVFEEWIISPIDIVYRLIEDERSLIESTLTNLVDVERCALVVTTGGTGPALRDVTPEATEAVCDKMMPGFGELMRAQSLKSVPTAILSRQTAGIRGQCLIVNLPGKPASIRECLTAVFPAIPYCIDLLGGPFLEASQSAPKVFRPANAQIKPSE